MKILNYGSLNLDFVYSVSHIAEPGETISSTALNVFCGGKGLNQSVALARAGAHVYHAGMIGPDGSDLLAACEREGVDTSFIRTVEERSGNAIIQVDDSGQNSIVLFGGANQKNEKRYIDETLSCFEKGDWILLQNEVNCLKHMIDAAFEKGIHIAFNPSPYNDYVKSCDLAKTSLLFINEVEGEQITGEIKPDKILSVLQSRLPETDIVLTLGKDGVIFLKDGTAYNHGVYDVPVIDTTAAGDTFTGYFLYAVLNNEKPEEALRQASVASSIAVSRKGAAVSIPRKDEIYNTQLRLCQG